MLVFDTIALTATAGVGFTGTDDVTETGCLGAGGAWDFTFLSLFKKTLETFELFLIVAVELKVLMSSLADRVVSGGVISCSLVVVIDVEGDTSLGVDLEFSKGVVSTDFLEIILFDGLPGLSESVFFFQY